MSHERQPARVNCAYRLQSKVRKEGDKLIQEQFGDKPCEIIREIEDDKLKTVRVLRARDHTRLICIGSRCAPPVTLCRLASTSVFKRVQLPEHLLYVIS